MLLVLVPQPVISAAATLLFGIVFMHGVHMLANVDWDDRKFMVAGLAVLVGLGGLFVSPKSCKHAADGEAFRAAAGDFGRTHAGRRVLAAVRGGRAARRRARGSDLI